MVSTSFCILRRVWGYDIIIIHRSTKTKTTANTPKTRNTTLISLRCTTITEPPRRYDSGVFLAVQVIHETERFDTVRNLADNSKRRYVRRGMSLDPNRENIVCVFCGYESK
eukprot:PhF_6_TR15059/c0_g1_i2/m.23662